jgi:hypothetical protein
LFVLFAAWVVATKFGVLGRRRHGVGWVARFGIRGTKEGCGGTRPGVGGGVRRKGWRVMSQSSGVARGRGGGTHLRGRRGGSGPWVFMEGGGSTSGSGRRYNSSPRWLVKVKVYAVLRAFGFQSWAHIASNVCLPKLIVWMWYIMFHPYLQA